MVFSRRYTHDIISAAAFSAALISVHGSLEAKPTAEDGGWRVQEARENGHPLQESSDPRSQPILEEQAQGKAPTPLTLITKLATLLNRATDFRTALQEILPLVLELVGSTTGWITLRQQESFELVAAHGLPPGLAANNMSLLRWSPCRCQHLALSGDLATTAEIINCERLARLREQAENSEKAEQLTGGLHWHLSVPLRTPSGNVIGILNLNRLIPGPLDIETKLFLDLLGELLASAIERDELATELRRLRSEERERATALAHRLVGQERLSDVAESIFTMLEPVLRPDAMSLLVVDPSEQYLVLRAGRGWSAQWVGRIWLPLNPPTHNGPAWALHTGHPFSVRLDQLGHPFHVPHPVLAAGVRLSAFFPLLANERPVGILVANYFTVRKLSEDQIRFAQLLAEIGAVAIARARERERNDELLSELPIGLFQLNAAGQIIQANRAFARLLGWTSPENVVGRPLADFFLERVEASRLWNAVRRGDAIAGTECRWRKHDGAVFWVRLSARTQHTPDGQVLFVEGTAEDISERKQIEEHLVYLARHDSLTGIANRYALIEALRDALARASRNQRSGALLLLDLDKFKLVNDQLGHAKGDAVLRSVAMRLSRAVRTSELVARLGGDEFAVLLFPVTREAAESVAQRLLTAIGEITVALPERVMRLKASCGIALFPEHGTSVEELLIAADRALYTAKYRGGSRFETYDIGGSQTNPPSATAFAQYLEAALATDTFCLLSQPILDLRSGLVSGHELLLRLREGNRLIDPSGFLPIAERLGLLPKIDLWVVERAAQLARAWGQGIHVNLSAQTLHDAQALRTLETIFEQQATPAGKVVLELTETVAIADFVWMREQLQRLRNYGCLLAIDDFGVGYSSLYQLRSFPVDFLKIDGSFTVDLLNDPVDRSIVHAIVELARALGAETIAEWVEHESLLDQLRTLGVDYAQGYAIGRPQLVEEF